MDSKSSLRFQWITIRVIYWRKCNIKHVKCVKALASKNLCVFIILKLAVEFLGGGRQPVTTGDLHILRVRKRSKWPIEAGLGINWMCYVLKLGVVHTIFMQTLSLQRCDLLCFFHVYFFEIVQIWEFCKVWVLCCASWRNPPLTDIVHRRVGEQLYPRWSRLPTWAHG